MEEKFGILRKTTILFFFILSISVVFGQADTIVVHSQTELQKIGTHLFFLKEKKEPYQLTDILKPETQKQFVALKKQIYAHPAAKTAVWFKITIQNKTGEDLWLETGGHLACNKIDFYRPDSMGQYGAPVLSGAFRPEKNKEFPADYYWFKLAGASNKKVQTFYVRLESVFPQTYPLQAGTLTCLLKNKEKFDYLSAGFLGLMLIMIFYNLFIAFATRDKAYYIYILYLVYITVNNLFTHDVYFTSVQWLWYKFLVWMPLGTIIMGWFVIVYLDLQKKMPRYYKFILALFAIHLLFAFLNLMGVPQTSLINIYQPYALLALLFYTIAGIYLWRKGVRNARYYVIGWTGLMLSLFIFLATINGVLPFNLYSQKAIYFGTCFEVLMFSIALGDRFIRLREEKEIAQKQNYKLIEEHNKELEEKLLARTIELEQSKEELLTQNEVLIMQRDELDQKRAEMNEINEQLVDAQEELKQNNEDLLTQNEILRMQMDELDIQRAELNEKNEKLITIEDELRQFNEKLLTQNEVLRMQMDELDYKQAELNERNAELLAVEEELRQNNDELVGKNKILQQQKEELDNQRAALHEKNEELLSAEEELRQNNEELLSVNEHVESQKQLLEDAYYKLQATQDQLIQSEKMASLGGLVAGVAHEINTPVGISITAASAFAAKTKELESIYKQGKMKKSDLEDFLANASEASLLILSNLTRTGELVQSFKQVSVDQASEAEREFNIADYFNSIILSLKPKLKKTKLKVEVKCPENLVIKSYPGAFAQIITNFIVNSIVHGFEEGKEGIISLEVRNEFYEIIIIYKDNGKGMSAEVQRKIFDPFYTTNKQKGTGLGMSIVYGIVTQKLNGTIELESQSGQGVEFTITIPNEL